MWESQRTTPISFCQNRGIRSRLDGNYQTLGKSEGKVVVMVKSWNVTLSSPLRLSTEICQAISACAAGCIYCMCYFRKCPMSLFLEFTFLMKNSTTARMQVIIQICISPIHRYLAQQRQESCVVDIFRYFWYIIVLNFPAKQLVMHAGLGGIAKRCPLKNTFLFMMQQSI